MSNRPHSTLVEGAFRHLIGHPWTATLTLVLVTAALAAGLRHVRIAADLKLLIPRDEVYLRDEAVRDAFGIRDQVIVGIVRDDGVFHPDTLAYAKSLAGFIADIDGVVRVRSLFSEDNIRGEGSRVDIAPFLDAVTADAAEAAARAVAEFPGVQGVLVSADQTCLALLAEIEDGADKPGVCRDIQHAIDNGAAPGGTEVHISGMPVFEGVLGDYIMRDVLLMFPLVTAMIALCLYAAYRSGLLVVLTVVEILVVNVWTVGLMGHLGVPFHTIHAAMPVILAALSVADEIHLFSRYTELAGPERERREAILQTMRDMWVPVVLTSLTTASGFLGFLATWTAPTRQFGVFTAAGVLGAMVFSLTMTPVALMLFGRGRPRDRAAGRLAECLGAFGSQVYARRRVVAAGVAVVLAGSMLCAGRIYVQDSWIGNFQESSEVRYARDVLNHKLSGTWTFEIAFDTGQPGGIAEPDALRQVLAFQDALDACPVVGKTLSLVQVLRKTNAEFTGAYTIPASRAAVAQYLMLLDGSSYTDLWDFDRRNLRVIAFCQRDDYLSGHTLFAAVDTAIREHTPGLQATVAGPYALGYHWTSLIPRNQITSFVTSLLLVSLSAGMLLRSVRKAAAVTLPVTAAVILYFGVMGALGTPLNIARSMLSSIILGIGVDYTIHLHAAYDRARRLKPHAGALRDAYASTGKAVLWNTVVIVLGFTTLALSNMPPTQQLGVTVSLGILTSLMAGSVVLPVLLSSKGNEGGS